VRYREDDRYRSGNPYAATKAGAEELAVSFHNTYGLPVIVTHTMNVIGPMQHPEKFVPMTIARVRAREMVTIHADKTCTQPGSRFYIHAEDVARALVFLTAAAMPGEKYNIVGEREIDNLELAQMISTSVGKPLSYELVNFHESRPGHDLRYALDGDKMAALGWKVDQPIEHAVEDIVRWTLAHPEWMLHRLPMRGAA
jgi:dTDP-glucose 4,6-dehydratase